MSIITGVLDTETTGLDPVDHRIIEVCIVLFRDRKPIGGVNQRIYPDRPIDPRAEMVHGISLRDLEGKPRFAEAAPKIFKALDRCDNLVAHNLSFDMGFFAAEFARLKYDLSGWVKKKGFCTLEEGRWATPTGKVPNLKELCFATGVQYDADRAHSALYDTVVLAKALFRGVDLGFFDLKVA